MVVGHLRAYSRVEHTPQAVRHEVPFVPGAFVLAGLLSPQECQQIIAATEAIGYRYAQTGVAVWLSACEKFYQFHHHFSFHFWALRLC